MYTKYYFIPKTSVMSKYNNFTTKEKQKLTYLHVKPPDLYRLPKLHKTDIPMGIIVSSIDSTKRNFDI